MCKRRLKLNSGNTETLIDRGTNWFVGADDFADIVVGSVSRVAMDSERNFGVIFDDSLNFVKHIDLQVRDDR